MKRDRSLVLKLEAGGIPQANVPEALPNITARYDRKPRQPNSNLTGGLYLDLEQVKTACCLNPTVVKLDRGQPEITLSPLRSSASQQLQTLNVNLKQHPESLLKVKHTTKQRVVVPPQRAYRKIAMSDLSLIDRKQSQPKNLRQQANIQRPNLSFILNEIGSEEPPDLLKQLTMRYYSQLPPHKKLCLVDVPQHKHAQLSKTTAKFESQLVQPSQQSQMEYSQPEEQPQQWQNQPQVYTPYKQGYFSGASTADRMSYPSAASTNFNQQIWPPQQFDSVFH